MSSTYCLYPFTNLNSNTEGSVKLCCSINENIHATGGDGQELNFGTHSIDEIWNSDYMTTVRKQMLNGERPEACAVCWRLEDKGIQSLLSKSVAKRLTRITTAPTPYKHHTNITHHTTTSTTTHPYHRDHSTLPTSTALAHNIHLLNINDENYLCELVILWSCMVGNKK